MELLAFYFEVYNLQEKLDHVMQINRKSRKVRANTSWGHVPGEEEVGEGHQCKPREERRKEQETQGRI